MLLLANRAYQVQNKNNRCQETEREKDKKEGSEKRQKWMSDAEGRKFTEIKHWLAERERESNELSPLCQYTAWMVLCKSWVYTHTHRLPPLGGTHNMKRARVCASVAFVWVGTWVHVCEHTMAIPLSYISRTKTQTHILYRQHAYKTIVLIQKGSDHPSTV